MLSLKLTSRTSLYCSFSDTPGNFGNGFHNYLFQAYGIDAIYKSFKLEDTVKVIPTLEALGVKGCALAKPHKSAILEYCDDAVPHCKKINASNTLVLGEVGYVAHNTDFIAACELIEKYSPPEPVLIVGAGGVARALAYAFVHMGYNHIKVWNRTYERCNSLVESFGVEAFERIEDVLNCACIVNATSVGMKMDDLPILDLSHWNTKHYWDLVVKPETTTSKTRSSSTIFVSGEEFAKHQASAQFELYSGIKCDDSIIERAYHYAKVNK